MSFDASAQEMRELIRCVAAHARDLAFLHQGDLEAVAITMHMHPAVVDAARARLDDPVERARFLAEVRHARAELEAAPTSAPAALLPPPPPAPSGKHAARDLVRAAAGHPYGSEFLEDGYPEAVAVVFGVHPEIVFRARDIVARWRRRYRIRSDADRAPDANHRTTA